MYRVECSCDRDTSGDHTADCLLNRADFDHPDECPACRLPLDRDDPHDPACPLVNVIPGACPACETRKAGGWDWARGGYCRACDDSCDAIADLADSLV